MLLLFIKLELLLEAVHKSIDLYDAVPINLSEIASEHLVKNLV